MSTDILDGLLRRDDDRVAVRFERRFATTADDLWVAVTDPGRLARWLAPATVDPRVGGRYALDFGEGEHAEGEVLACEAPTLLRVTWDFPDEPTSVVEVRIAADGDGAVLVLDHTRLPVDQAGGYGAGWHAYLDRLAGVAADQPPPDWDERFGAVLAGYRAALADLA